MAGNEKRDATPFKCPECNAPVVLVKADPVVSFGSKSNAPDTRYECTVDRSHKAYGI